MKYKYLLLVTVLVTLSVTCVTAGSTTYQDCSVYGNCRTITPTGSSGGGSSNNSNGSYWTTNTNQINLYGTKDGNSSLYLALYDAVNNWSTITQINTGNTGGMFQHIVGDTSGLGNVYNRADLGTQNEAGNFFNNLGVEARLGAGTVAGLFTDSNNNDVYLADGTNAIATTGKVYIDGFTETTGNLTLDSGSFQLGGTITDNLGSSINSIDTNNRYLTDTTGQNSIDWANRQLNIGTTYQSTDILDWNDITKGILITGLKTSDLNVSGTSTPIVNGIYTGHETNNGLGDNYYTNGIYKISKSGATWFLTNQVGSVVFGSATLTGTYSCYVGCTGSLTVSNGGITTHTALTVNGTSIFIGNITAPNICYSNGTGCQSSGTFNSTYNNILNQNCPSGKVVNGTYSNGTFICINQSSSSSMNLTNIALLNQSNNFNNNNEQNITQIGLNDNYYTPNNFAVFNNNNANIYLITYLNNYSKIDLNETAGSFNFWINANATGSYSAILSDSYYSNQNPGYYCYWDNQVRCGTGNSSSYLDTPSGVISLKTWTMITFIWNSTNQSIYVNGVIKASGVTRSNIFYNHQFNLFNNNGGTSLNGSIDELAIWNRRLNQSEITSLYNSGSGTYGQIANSPFNSGLVAGWHFDNNQSSTFPDFSGNGFNLASNGGTYKTYNGIVQSSQNIGNMNYNNNQFVFDSPVVASNIPSRDLDNYWGAGQTTSGYWKTTSTSGTYSIIQSGSYGYTAQSSNNYFQFTQSGSNSFAINTNYGSQADTNFNANRGSQSGIDIEGVLRLQAEATSGAFVQGATLNMNLNQTAGNINTQGNFSVNGSMGVTQNFVIGVNTQINFKGGIATAISTAFDRNLMQNITYLSNTSGLNPVSFYWNNQGLKQFEDTNQWKGVQKTGYVAQDVLLNYPSCVINETEYQYPIITENITTLNHNYTQIYDKNYTWINQIDNPYNTTNQVTHEVKQLLGVYLSYNSICVDNNLKADNKNTFQANTIIANDFIQTSKTYKTTKNGKNYCFYWFNS